MENLQDAVRRRSFAALKVFTADGQVNAQGTIPAGTTIETISGRAMRADCGIRKPDIRAWSIPRGGRIEIEAA